MRRCDGKYVEEIWTCVTFSGFGVDGAGVKIVSNDNVLVAASRRDRETTGLIRVNLTSCVFNLHEDIMCVRAVARSLWESVYHDDLLLRKRVCYSVLFWWSLKTEWELLVPGGGHLW